MADSASPSSPRDVESGKVPLSNNDYGFNNSQYKPSDFAKDERTWLFTFIRTLRFMALMILLVSYSLQLINHFVLDHAPLERGPVSWDKERTKALAAWTFAAIILTCMTFILTAFGKVSVSPSVIAIAIDSVLAAGIIRSAIRFTDGYPHPSWCSPYRNGIPVNPHPECAHWKEFLWILMKLSFSASIILGIIFVILAVCQIMLLCKAHSNKSRNVLKSLTLRLPYTLKFNISLERRDDPSVVQVVEQPLGQGPVHL